VSGFAFDADASLIVTAVPDLDHVIVGALLRLWWPAQDRFEDHRIWDRRFLHVMPWVAGSFAITGSVEAAPTLVVRSFEAPLEDAARLEIDGSSVRQEGPRELWPDEDLIVPLGFPNVLRFEGGVASLHTTTMPETPDRGDGDQLIVTPHGDGRSVAVTHSRMGREVSILDVVQDRVVHRWNLGSLGVTAELFLPVRNELWLVEGAQLRRFDARSWIERSSTRLPTGPYGHVPDLDAGADGHRVAVSVDLTTPMLGSPPAAAPAGGRIVILDAATVRPVAAANAPRWVTEVAMLPDGRVCGNLFGSSAPEPWLGTPLSLEDGQ
jgi:hypothetical protein